MFLSERREFPSAPCLAKKKKKTLMTSRVSMLLKSRASLTCFRVCFFPGHTKGLSAPRYFPLKQYHNFAIHAYIPATPTSLTNCSTRRRAPRVTQRAHVPMGSTHGGMSQPQRKTATFVSSTGMLISPQPDQEGNKLESMSGPRAISTTSRRELLSSFFFQPARQGAEGNSRHSDRNISLFPSWSD